MNKIIKAIMDAIEDPETLVFCGNCKDHASCESLQVYCLKYIKHALQKGKA